MEQLFFAGKAYLKINLLVKTPLHEFMAVERSGLWAPGYRELSHIPLTSLVTEHVFFCYGHFYLFIFYRIF